jgi:hypothetical protein
MGFVIFFKMFIIVLNSNNLINFLSIKMSNNSNYKLESSAFVVTSEYGKIVPLRVKNRLMVYAEKTDIPTDELSDVDDVLLFLNKKSINDDLSVCYIINDDNILYNNACLGYRLPTEKEWQYIYFLNLLSDKINSSSFSLVWPTNSKSDVASNMNITTNLKEEIEDNILYRNKQNDCLFLKRANKEYFCYKKCIFPKIRIILFSPLLPGLASFYYVRNL